MEVLKSFILGGTLIGGSKFISQYIDPHILIICWIANWIGNYIY